MARYKPIDTSPRFLAVDLKRQRLPGTFEHALDHLLDHEIDLSALDARFKNDETGASAYPPAMLLKVILFAYSQGIVRSRGIEQACREHTRVTHRPDEETHRFARGPGTLWQAFCDGRAGVRQSSIQQAARSLYLARENQGRCAVEALLPGPQHREARPSRVCAVAKRRSTTYRGAKRTASSRTIERFSASSALRLPQHHRARSRTTKKGVFLQPQRIMNRIRQMLNPYIRIYNFLSVDICICAGISTYISVLAQVLSDDAALQAEFTYRFPVHFPQPLPRAPDTAGGFDALPYFCIGIRDS